MVLKDAYKPASYLRSAWILEIVKAMVSSLLKYSLFEHGLLELTTASEEIWLLHDTLEGEGRHGNVFLIFTQQCRKLYIMNLSLEDTLHLAELLFCCIEVCCVCPGS